jgi:hypothetical protein
MIQFAGQFYTADKAVSAARDGLDIARPVGIVEKCLAQALDSAVQPVVEINESVGGPEAFAQKVACDQFTRMLEEVYQYLDGMAPQFELDPVFAKFS